MNEREQNYDHLSQQLSRRKFLENSIGIVGWGSLLAGLGIHFHTEGEKQKAKRASITLHESKSDEQRGGHIFENYERNKFRRRTLIGAGLLILASKLLIARTILQGRYEKTGVAVAEKNVETTVYETTETTITKA